MTVALVWATGWFAAGLIVAWGLREELWLSLASKYLSQAIVEREAAIAAREAAEAHLEEARGILGSLGSDATKSPPSCFIGGGK